MPRYFRVKEIQTITTIHLVDAKDEVSALRRMRENDRNYGTYVCIGDRYEKEEFSIMPKEKE